MRHRLTAKIRRGVMVACLIAAIAMAARVDEVVALRRHDRLVELTYQRGLELAVAQRYDDAADTFRQVLALAPRAGPAYESLADVEVKRGRVDVAIQTYTQLLAIYPYTYLAALYRQLGLIELRSGRLPDARSHLQQAVELDPADWMAFYLLGHALEHLGDAAGARTAWRRVINLNPQFQPVYAHLRQHDDRP